MRLYKTTELRVNPNHYLALEIDQTIERLLEQVQASYQQPLRLVSVSVTPLASSYGVTEHVLVTVVAELDTSALERAAPRLEYKSGASTEAL